MKNYYAVLGIATSADDEAIKAAYRQNAKRYHPDLNPGNESYQKRFLEIKTAYEILGNPESKKKYDNEIAVYIKAKQARRAQQSAAQKQQQSPPPPPPPQPQKTAATLTPRVEIERIKKMHSLQLELLRVASKENMLKYRKRLQEQLDSYKKDSLIEREKEKRQNKATFDKMLAKMKEYKTTQKKDSFNDGFKKGMKAAQDSAKRTIDELKSLIVNNGGSPKDSGNKKMQNLEMELSLINEKNRELTQQIELLEILSAAGHSSSDDDGLRLQLEQATAKIDELTSQVDTLKADIINFESEIDSLNEEILYLEGFNEIWQDVISDNTVTKEELDIIAEYQSLRNAENGTYYGTLGLPVNALPDEINAAYLRLKKRYEGKESQTGRYLSILEAYNILSNPRKKQAYDETINNESDI